MSKAKKTTEELLQEALLSKEEAPYEVPENWIWIELNDILNSLSYGILKPGDEDLEGIPMIRVLDIDYGKFRDTQLFKVSPELHKEYSRTETEVGDILLAVMATIGRAVVVDEEHSGFNVNRALAVLKLNDKVIPQFVCNLILSPYFQKIFVEKKLGSAQSRINLKDLRTFKIPLPPLNEQKRIVEKLDILLNKVDEAKQIIEEVKKTFELRRTAILDKAFRGELTAQWRAENKHIDSALEQIEEHHVRRVNEYKLNKSNKAKKPEYLKHELKDVVKQNSNLPNEWVVAPVGFLCDCIVPGRDKPKSFTGNIPWVTIPDVINDEIHDNQSKLSLSQQEIEEVNAKVIPENSVIMSCVGRFGISTVVKRPIVINQQLHAFLPSELILPEYLMYHIKILKKYMSGIATSTTIAYLNKTNANSLPINLATIEEQGVIVEILESLLSKLDAQESLISEMDEKLETLKQSIFSKAFRGELGTNNPSEESAIELLKDALQEQVK